MTETLVIDASIAVKWVVEEDGTSQALSLRRNHQFTAPDLFVAECANILWKKTQRGELTTAEASVAANLLERSDVELFPMRSLLTKATELALQLGHPAYDCIYLCLALSRNCRFVTADERLLRVLREKAAATMVGTCVTMDQVIGRPSQSPRPANWRLQHSFIP